MTAEGWVELARGRCVVLVDGRVPATLVWVSRARTHGKVRVDRPGGCSFRYLPLERLAVAS